MIHLGVFLAVVFTYDWMKDESSNKCVEDTDREEDLNEETNFLV